MSPSLDETRLFIAWAHGLGATFVKVGDVSVKFDLPAAVHDEPPQDLTPEQQAIVAKEERERLLYGSSF